MKDRHHSSGQHVDGPLTTLVWSVVRLCIIFIDSVYTGVFLAFTTSGYEPWMWTIDAVCLLDAASSLRRWTRAGLGVRDIVLASPDYLIGTSVSLIPTIWFAVAGTQVSSTPHAPFSSHLHASPPFHSLAPNPLSRYAWWLFCG